MLVLEVLTLPVCFYREEDLGISPFWIPSLLGFGFSCCWRTWQSAACSFWWRGKYSAPHWHLQDLNNTDTVLKWVAQLKTTQNGQKKLSKGNLP